MADGLSMHFSIEPVLNANRLNAILRKLKSALGPLGKEIKEIDADRLEESLDDATDAAKKLEKETEKIDDNLKKAAKHNIGGGFRKVMSDIAKFAGGQLLAGAVSTGFNALANGIASVGRSMLQGASEMETYKTQLTSLLHDSQLAEERLKELAKFGAETPFELTELIEAEKVLIGFGLQGEKAMKMTGKSASDLRTIIGDVAAGIGVPFEELAVTIGKFSTGATGEAIARLQELGIVTKEELQGAGIEFDRAGSLASSVPEALTAATAIMEQKFGGGMKALSQTAEGQISTLKDNLAQIFRDLGTPLFEALKPAIGKINELLTSEETKNAITQLGTALGNIATTILPPIMQLLSTLMPLISSWVAAIIPILSSLFEAVIPVVQILAEQLAPVFTQIFTNLQPLITTLLQMAGQILPLLLNALAPVWDLLPLIYQLLSDLLVPILGALMPILIPLIEIISALIKKLEPALKVIIEIANIAIKPLIFVVEILVKLLKPFIDLFALLSNWIADAVVVAVDFVRKGAEPIVKVFEEIIKVIDSVIDGISDFINGIGEAIGLVEKKQFKAPINPNYADDMNKAADANRNFNNSLAEGAKVEGGGTITTPPIPKPSRPKPSRPKPSDDSSKTKIKDISDEIVRVQREAAKIERDEQVKRIKDERLRERTALQNKFNDTILALEEEIAKTKERKDISNAQKIEMEKALNNKIRVLTEKHLLELADLDKKYEDKKLEEEKKAIEELNKEELKAFEDTLKSKQRLQEMLINIGTSTAKKSADSQLADELAKLDRLKENNLLSEASYQAKREKLEKDHQNRLSQIQATANGLRIEAERQQALALLEEKKKLLEAELAVDPENETKIKQLEELNRAIAEKGDLLLANAELLQTGLAEIFGNLFAGEDAIKDSARNLFATLAGILKKLAAATITQIVLNQLGIASIGTGAAVFAFAPVIQATVSALVNAILDPIIASITSFASGGRVDSPTIILAGDASKARPGSDTEWIFRDDQIRALIDGVIWKYMQLNVTAQEFSRMNIQDALSGLSGEIKYLTGLFKSDKDLSITNLKAFTEQIFKDDQIKELIDSVILFKSDKDLSVVNLKAFTEQIFKDDQIKELIDSVIWKYIQLNVTTQEFNKINTQDTLLGLSSKINNINTTEKLFYSNRILDEKLTELITYSQTNIKSFTSRTNIQDTLLGLSSDIKYLTGVFKSDKDLSVVNLKTLFNEINNINTAEQSFYSNRISGEELAELIMRSQTNIRSFAKGGILSSPELILAGDAGASNPELILTLPMLRNIIEETSNMTSRAIEAKLDELINKFDEFEGRIHIIESDVGRAVNNYNYRQKRKNVIK